MKNILTFDVEEWYDANYREIDLGTIDSTKSNLEHELKDLLDVCKRFGSKATFFVLGRVAEQKPHLVEMIHAEGHEIASHGYDHKLVYELSPKEFKEDLQKSLSVLESITGKKIIGYRAPSWSFTKETSWVYDIMADMGIRYSASVFPIRTFLYGIPDAPRFPYVVHTKNQKKRILEIPTSTIRMLRTNIPFSGGAYFRFLPSWVVHAWIKKINKAGHPVIVYLHPREIDPAEQRLKLPWKMQLLHYWGVSQTMNKLERVLRKFPFTGIESELLSQYTI